MEKVGEVGVVVEGVEGVGVGGRWGQSSLHLGSTLFLVTKFILNTHTDEVYKRYTRDLFTFEDIVVSSVS